MQTGRWVAIVTAITAVAAVGALARPLPAAASGGWHNVVYVADRGQNGGSVTAYDPATATTTQIPTPGMEPRWVALTPDGATAVVSSDTGGVVEIDTATSTITRSLSGVGVGGVAISPDGGTAWVNTGSTLTPITIATGATGTAIALPGPVSGNTCGYLAGGVVLTRDGTTAYVADSLAEAVVPVNLVTGAVGTPISTGPFGATCPVHIALGVEDADPFVYVTDNSNHLVLYIDPATSRVLYHDSEGNQPYGVAETWDQLFIGDLSSPSHMLQGNPYDGALGPSCLAGTDLAVSPDGDSMWVSNDNSDYASSVALGGCATGATFATAQGPRQVAVTPELLTVSGVPVSAQAGQAFSGTVATFTDPNTSRPLSDFGASIDWGDGSGTSSGTVTGSAGSFSVAGTHTYASYGTYAVRVTAYFKQSPPFDVTTSAVVPGPPGPPTNLAGAGGGGRVFLGWNAPATDNGAPVTGYDVYVGTSSGGESTTPANPSPVGATSYTVTGLTNGTMYYFTVRAINSYGHGVASNETSATPVADDFTISVTPQGSIWLNPGSTVAYTVSTTNTAGLGQSLTLSATGLPRHVTAVFGNQPMLSGDVDQLTLVAGSTAPASKLLTFTVTATGSESSHAATAQVQVVPLGVANGGFATGTLKDWSSKGTVSVIQGNSADGDGYSVEVGSSSSTSRVSSVSETFTVPEGASTVTFSWWGVCGGSPDLLSATIRDLTTGKGGGAFATCSLSSGWTTQHIFVTPGDTVTLSLSVRDDHDTGSSNYALFDAVSSP